jgi:hypothetical protein
VPDDEYRPIVRETPADEPGEPKTAARKSAAKAAATDSPAQPATDEESA